MESGRGPLNISCEEGVEFPVNKNGAKEGKIIKKTGSGNMGSYLLFQIPLLGKQTQYRQMLH